MTNWGRVAIRMVLAAPTLAVVVLLISTARAAGLPAPEVRLEVDLSDRVLRVHLAGELMNSFPVAVGEARHPTPRGSFTIDRIVWNPDWPPTDASACARPTSWSSRSSFRSRPARHAATPGSIGWRGTTRLPTR